MSARMHLACADREAELLARCHWSRGPVYAWLGFQAANELVRSGRFVFESVHVCAVRRLAAAGRTATGEGEA